MIEHLLFTLPYISAFDALLLYLKFSINAFDIERPKAETQTKHILDSANFLSQRILQHFD